MAAGAGAFGLFIAFCVAQVGSLFSSDAWNNITFTAAEVREPRRNIPLSLALGTGLVITLYLLANVAYLCMLPLDTIQHAAADRVATSAIETLFSGTVLSVAIASGQGAVALVTGGLLARSNRTLQYTVLLGLSIGVFDFVMYFLQMAVPATELNWIPDLAIIVAITVFITIVGSRKAATPMMSAT